MDKEKVPQSCCDDYGNCDQGRNCPVRSTPVNTAPGGKQVDTEESLLDWIDKLVIGARFTTMVIVAVCLSIVVFYFL